MDYMYTIAIRHLADNNVIKKIIKQHIIPGNWLFMYVMTSTDQWTALILNAVPTDETRAVKHELSAENQPQGS